MLQLLSERAAKLGPSASDRLNTIHTNALTFTPKGEYDLIVTHFFLDCLSEQELENLLPRITPHIAGATWVVSEFAIPASPPKAVVARLVVAILYRTFRVITGLQAQKLPDYATLFSKNQLSLIAPKCFLGGLLVSQLWKFQEQPIPLPSTPTSRGSAPCQ